MKNRLIDRRSVVLWLGASLALLAARPALALDFPDWYTIGNAASLNKTDDVLFMLRRGDNPNMYDGNGRTPLDYAASFGNAPMAQALLENGARADYRDTFGNSALHWAAEGGKLDVVRVLLTAKAPVDATNKQGITPLMQAAGRGRNEVVRALLAAGADPKKQDFTGRDAEGWAQGQPNVMRTLQAAHPLATR